MSKQVDHQYHKKESNFASGLVWGVILGIAGMFLFGTKKGKKLKENLLENSNNLLEELEVICDETLEKKKPGKKKLIKEKLTRSKKAKKDEAAQDLTHIAKLQERGRKTARKFFTRKGKALK